MIGYSVDGFAIMGHGTYIFEPDFNGNRVTGHNGNIETLIHSDILSYMKPSISGYKLKTNWKDDRKILDSNAPDEFVQDVFILILCMIVHPLLMINMY